MAELDDIYNTRLLELAAAIPRGERLQTPDASASAHSKLCGSTIVVDVSVEDGRIADFGQTVKACLLGQASASIVGREIVGTPPAEFRTIATAMRRMLKENGPPPDGRWADLALLAPVKDYPHRHASTLLVFDATEKALDEIASREDAAGKSGATVQ
jgi:NifU-like protein involved in Fe-S cluster formation